MSNMQDRIKNWIANSPELVYNEATSNIYCSKCDIHLKLKKYSILKHLQTDRHKNFSEQPDSKHEFYLDLIIFLLSCNIPWSTINNNNFRYFFNKYVCCHGEGLNRTLPDESLLRKVYLKTFYNNTIQNVRQVNNDNYLCIYVHKTPDLMGKCVTNVVIRPLQKNYAQQFYLLGTKILEKVKVDGIVVANLIKSQLKFLFLNSFEDNVNKVLLLCTENADYMIKAGHILKSTFPHMKHITCLAQGLHQVEEEVRHNFKDVDALISDVKMFFKSPERARIFKEKYPTIPIPPQPTITEWGSWINASVYYAQYYEQIRDLILMLVNEPALIRCFENKTLQDKLNFIRDNYAIIPSTIKQLQSSTLPIMDSFLIMDTVRCYLGWSKLLPVINKLEAVLDQNPDYDILREISDNLSQADYYYSEHSLYNEFYEFAPLTLSKVEHDFSVHNLLYNEKRTRLSPDNIEKLMVIYFYHRRDELLASSTVCTDVDFEEEIASAYKTATTSPT